MRHGRCDNRDSSEGCPREHPDNREAINAAIGYCANGVPGEYTPSLQKPCLSRECVGPWSSLGSPEKSGKREKRVSFLLPEQPDVSGSTPVDESGSASATAPSGNVASCAAEHGSEGEAWRKAWSCTHDKFFYYRLKDNYVAWELPAGADLDMWRIGYSKKHGRPYFYYASSRASSQQVVWDLPPGAVLDIEGVLELRRGARTGGNDALGLGVHSGKGTINTSC